MTIERDGIFYELTNVELIRAYREYQRMLDGEDIDIILDEYRDYDGGREEFEETYNFPVEDAENNREWLVSEKRDLQDNGLTWREAVDGALENLYTEVLCLA